MSRSLRGSVRAAHAALLGLAVALCAGCGSGGVGVISGKVTVEGKPLKKGSIHFLSEVGNRDAFTASISDGTYRIPDVPAGPAKVYISTPPEQPDPETGPKGGDLLPPPKLTTGPRPKSPIPEKYLSADTSELSLTVKKGENTFDVNMVP
jgi:hypothetical protein